MLHGAQIPGNPPFTWIENAALPLYRLWGSHFGDALIDVEVVAPALEFEGALTVVPATDPPVTPGPVSLFLNSGGSGAGYAWTKTGADSMTMALTDFAAEAYPIVGTVDVTGGMPYRLTYEARIIGQPAADIRLGMGFVDTRGWEATHSGNAVEGIEHATDWTTLTGTLTTLPDATGLYVLWRLIGQTDPTTATLEVRNLRVTREPTFPPYAALTAAASLSADSRTLYLIVFNKHHAEDIATTIHLDGAAAREARIWTVTGPDLAATNLQSEQVRETVTNAPLPLTTPRTLTHTFPARSMSAIEFPLLAEPPQIVVSGSGGQ